MHRTKRKAVLANGNICGSQDSFCLINVKLTCFNCCNVGTGHSDMSHSN